MKEIMKESIGKVREKQKTVLESIKKDSIVWFRTSNQEINCGIVMKISYDTKSATVMNYDAWSVWNIDFEDIVRVGVSFYGDEYHSWMSRNVKNS